MKINTSSDHFLIKKSDFKDLFNIMKICLFLLFAFAFQLMATNTNAQDAIIELKSNSVTVSQLISEIEKQTDYLVVYSNREVNTSRTVSLKNKSDKVSEYLNQTFSGTDIGYDFEKNYIVLSKKTQQTANTITNLAQALQQQGKTVRGAVTDSNGEPVIGATIVVKDKPSQGTVTDIDGNFILSNLPENAVLQVTYVGMKPQEIITAGRNMINIIMESDIELLDEVVVVGYGTMKKSDLTGSVGQIKSDDINSVPTANILQSIAGRVSGVDVKQNHGAPGAPVSIRIRGFNSIQGSNEPLYVIDGFPTNNLSILNNSDIESIEILKDASSTAIYGSRGANGVVLITTKQAKVGEPSIFFETNYGIQSLRKKMEFMDASEYAQFTNEIRINDKREPYFSQNEIERFGKGFDWQDMLFQKAPIITTSFSINGGNNRTKYFLGGSILKQDGIIKTSSYDRYSVSTKLNQFFSDNFSLNFTSNLSRIETGGQQPVGGNRGSGIIAGTLSAPPTLTPYNEDGTYRNLLTSYPFISNSITNPINSLFESNRLQLTNMILTHIDLIYNPIRELTIKLTGGIENQDQRSDNYMTNNILSGDAIANVGTVQTQSILGELTANYIKTFSQNHTISTLVGVTSQEFKRTSLSSGSAMGFISDITETYDLSAAEVKGIPSSSYSKSAILSGLARVNYNFKDRLLATLSFRADGASQYSKGDKWGYFPSAALAWRVSNEDFFKEISYVSNLKMRLSWGVSGSQAIGAYSTLNILYSGTTVFGKELHNTYSPGTRLPGKLKWETTESKNFGVDIGILKNRINITADYYLKDTRDLLNTVGLPLSFGYNSMIQNVGKMHNRGFEFGVDAFLLSGKFNWEINSNISFNRNKVTKLYSGQDILGGAINVNLVQDNLNILREGEPVGRFWGYLEDGYDENGSIKFKDLNDDGRITTDDKTFIGNPHPNFIYGFNSNMSYKKFELIFFFQGSQGNDLFNISSINNTLDYGIGLNMPKDVYLNHWTPANINAKYPVAKTSTNVKASNRFVEDGSFIRLKNVEFAYNLELKKYIKTIRFFISGQNLLTFTNYSWWDPEINSYGGANSVNLGLDHYSYPTSKTISFGLQVKF